MRIAIGGIVHETNTYCQGVTPLAAFGVLEGEAMLRLRGTETQSGGAIDFCLSQGWEPVPVLWAHTQPSGIIDGEAYQTLKARFLDGLAAAMPVDGVFLDLHGAGVAEGVDDLEADLAEAVRRLVGDGVPVTAAFDLHANLTQRMADALDGVFVCHEYPHIDQHLRACEAVALIGDMREHGYRTTVQVETLPILMPTTTTFHGIGRDLRDRLLALEAANPDVVDVSLCHGFPYCDVPQVGCHVVVTSRGEAGQAHALARQFASEIWSRREELRAVSLSAEDAVAAARAATARPVVINETSDNCGGGSPGDGTHLLRAMLEAGLENACFGFIVDAAVAQQAHAAGVGAQIDVQLGGRTDTLHGAPLSLSVYVKALHDGRCVMQAMAKGSRINYGRLARLQVNGMDVVVASRRSQTFDTEPFLAVGIDVTRMDYVALKSSNHFRAGFEPLAGTIITADPPGLTTHHVEIFPRHRNMQPMWPIDDGARYAVEPL
ncbi:MAG: M81 family metallopeptidase [Pseudomonadales bacterium]